MIKILLNTCVINAQILYNMRHCNSNMTVDTVRVKVKQFRESLINKMLNFTQTNGKHVQQANIYNINTHSFTETQKKINLET